MPAKLIDNSIRVKAALNEITQNWLETTANEIASHAKSNVQMDGDVGNQLRGSYRADVNREQGVAQVGTPLESGFWEEFGTGEYADTGKNGGKPGRQGWWVYKDGYKGRGGKRLTEAQAKAMAEDDPTVHATNGREPSYTLEKAFIANKQPAIDELERQLKRGLDE